MDSRRFRDHKYKGFFIRPTYQDDWTLELVTEDIKLCEKFYDNEEHYFRTLKEAKQWISENGEQLLKKYLEKGGEDNE